MTLASLPEDRHDYVVRIVSPGPPAESVPIAPHTRVEIGHALDADIVIRRPAMKGQRVALTLSDHAAAVEVLEGEASVLGQALGGKVRALLPPYVPLMIGDIAIAYGRPGDPTWVRAERLAVALDSVRDAPAAPASGGWAGATRRGAAVGAGLARALRESLIAKVAALAIGASLLAVAALALGSIRPGQITRPAQIADVLRQTGFPTLTVQSREGRPPLIVGVVRNDAAAARLMATLEARQVRANLAVTTSDAIARQVEDIFRSNGLAGVATAGAAGEVVLALPADTDPLRIEGPRRLALTTLPALRQLRVTRQADASPAPSSEAIHIVDVRPGPDGYVATADGAKYFVGGVLPTGQTIRSIEARRLLLEGAGGVTNLDIEGDAS